MSNRIYATMVGKISGTISNRAFATIYEQRDIARIYCSFYDPQLPTLYPNAERISRSPLCGTRRGSPYWWEGANIIPAYYYWNLIFIPGKSSIVSRLSGIAPLATLCPIEWHFKFTSSETWSSCVSVSRWHTEGGQQALRAYKHQSLRVVCSNPQELHLLIMRAVILASSQAANGVASSNSLMTPEQVRNAYVKTISSSEHPCGVVHIYLELPHYRQDVSSPLTVVDLPGLSGQHIDYVKGLVKYYTKFSRNNRCIVAVVERGGGGSRISHSHSV